MSLSLAWSDLEMRPFLFSGANIGAAVVIKVLEMPPAIRLPLPAALVWAYPALNFNYESWMSVNDLAVLRQESQGNLLGLRHQKDHLSHRGPLSLVDDKPRKRKSSWSQSLSKLSGRGKTSTPTTPSLSEKPSSLTGASGRDDRASGMDQEGDEDLSSEDEESLARRVKYRSSDDDEHHTSNSPMAQKSPLVTPISSDKIPKVMKTRLTMTSRSACFNDRVLSAPMMRSMVRSSISS